jgi:hypothetical protein
MAVMVPENAKSFQTPGEERFYHFLFSVARPDSDFLVWYLPDIDGRELDFLLFNKELGLIVLEVKDWTLDQIINGNKKDFELNIGGAVEIRKNPLFQGREYALKLIEKIKEESSFISSDPQYKGKAIIPVSFGAVLININKFEFLSNRFDQVIDPNKTFFNEDLSPYSLYCNDPSGDAFRKRLSEMFPPLFPFKFSNKKIARLRKLIFPIVSIDLPSRTGSDAYNQHKQMLAVLDHHQESAVRSLSGCQLILGPAGSGKTLILVHQAACLFAKKPANFRMLFVCYNISLVHYIKRLLAAKGVPLGSQGVEVLHYNELCGKILGEKIVHEGENSEYFETLTKLSLDEVVTSNLRYEAIFVDEGQDFSSDMAKVIIGLLSSSYSLFSVAFDERQSIYGDVCDWVKIYAQPWQIQKLKHVYRNTHEINKLALKVVHEPAVKELTTPEIAFLPENFGNHGPDPVAIFGKTGDEIMGFVSDEIVSLRANESVPFSEIAVLYISRQSPYACNSVLPEEMCHVLESKGILVEWMSEDFRSKKSYDITTDKVCVSTVHSVKGMDYDTVFVIGLESLLEPRWDEDIKRKLVYIALTRARRRAYFGMLCSTKTLRLGEILVLGDNSVQKFCN